MLTSSDTLSPLTTSSQWVPGCRSRQLFPGLASLMEWFEDTSLEAVFAAAAHYAVLEDSDSSRTKYKWILKILEEADNLCAACTPDSLARRVESTPPECDDPLLPHPFIRYYSSEDRQTIKLIVQENLDYLTHIEQQREYMKPAPIQRIGYRDDSGDTHFFRCQHDRSKYDKAQQAKFQLQQQQQQILLQQLQEQRNALMAQPEAPTAASNAPRSLDMEHPVPIKASDPPILPPAAANMMQSSSNRIKSHSQIPILNPVQQIQSLRPFHYRCLPPSVSQHRQQLAEKSRTTRSTSTNYHQRSTQHDTTQSRPIIDLSQQPSSRAKTESCFDVESTADAETDLPQSLITAKSSNMSDRQQANEEIYRYRSLTMQDGVTIKLAHSRILSDSDASHPLVQWRNSVSDSEAESESESEPMPCHQKDAQTNQCTKIAIHTAHPIVSPVTANASIADVDESSPAFVPLPSRVSSATEHSSLPIASISELDSDEMEDIKLNKGRGKKRRVLFDDSSDEEDADQDQDVVMITQDVSNAAHKSESESQAMSQSFHHKHDITSVANMLAVVSSAPVDNEMKDIEDDFDLPVPPSEALPLAPNAASTNQKQKASKSQVQASKSKLKVKHSKSPLEQRIDAEPSTKKRKRGERGNLKSRERSNSNSIDDKAASITVTAVTRKKPRKTPIISPLESLEQDVDEYPSRHPSTTAAAASISPASQAVNSLLKMQFSSRKEALAFLSQANIQTASTPKPTCSSSTSEPINSELTSGDTSVTISRNTEAKVASILLAPASLKKLNANLHVEKQTLVNQETGLETIVFVLTRTWKRLDNNRLESHDK